MTLAEKRREILHKHWRAILKIESAEPNQNFFQLGGDSLAAMELIARVHAESGWELPMETLFTTGTLADLEDAPA